MYSNQLHTSNFIETPVSTWEQQIRVQGWHRSGNSQGKIELLMVKEKSGNFILNQGNFHIEEKSQKIEITTPLKAGRGNSVNVISVVFFFYFLKQRLEAANISDVLHFIGQKS